MKLQSAVLPAIAISLLSIAYFIYSGKSMSDVSRDLSRMLAPNVRPMESEPAVESPKPKPVVNSRAPKFTPKPAQLPQPVVEEVTPQAPAPPPPPPPAPAFPEPSDITLGTSRSDLLARYPSPSMRTSSVKEGILIEYLHYKRPGRPTSTRVELKNGTVSHVGSESVFSPLSN